MRRIVMGILAHVDAGKTTLSEGLLYQCGKIRKLGRVDKGDAFLDTYDLEKQRGITIFSKQARLEMGDVNVTLMDTPGHVDFSAEMERTLQILDVALLIVNGSDGVTGHTMTLWRLLKSYHIPTFIFVNKMDQITAQKEVVWEDMKKHISGEIIDFSRAQMPDEEFYEQLAMADEAVMEYFLEQGTVEDEQITGLIRERKIFPVYFGSALKLEGIDEFIRGFTRFAPMPDYGSEFGARIYKVSRDEKGNRLTFMKITGGKLSARQILTIPLRTSEDGAEEEGEDSLLPFAEEKVNQIRLYSGAKFEHVQEAEAGCVCAVSGLEKTAPGMGLGAEEGFREPLLEPVITYQLLLPEGTDASVVLPDLRKIEEEIPEMRLRIERDGSIQVRLMGEIQLQILQQTIRDRLHLEVSFGAGKIIYKETITNKVEGVGHFEPLRHYAEVHLLLEAGERGSGLHFSTDCSEDILDKNWQRLILTHLQEKNHRGVLTGASITDMNITLVSGKAHIKHTMGGDFRQATYRALRQGLMQAESKLLEPYYDFRLEVPDTMIGRAMSDLERMGAIKAQPEIEGNMAILIGSAPVSVIGDYQKEVTEYTKGQGHISFTLKGYDTCHNPEEVIALASYDPERDLRNTPDSVFCSHGAGYVVPWHEVPRHMHVPSVFSEQKPLTLEEEGEKLKEKVIQTGEKEISIGTEEIDAILAKTAYANRKPDFIPHKGISAGRKQKGESIPSDTKTYGVGQALEKKRRLSDKEFFLVDGYNIIYAWNELKELAKTSLDGARGKLMDELCDYQAIKGVELIVVFDAYRLSGHPEETSDYHNIHVVFTKEAETADQYIERFTHEQGKKYKVTVATSDGLEQIIIRGQGALLISARELKEEIKSARQAVVDQFQEQKEVKKISLGEFMPDQEFPQ